MKKYMWVYEKIKGDIVSGAIKYGQKLPSKRTLSDTMNVSVITVEHACEILESEGYITAKARSGYYVEYTTEAVYRSADVSIKEKHTPPDAVPSESFPFSVFAGAVRSVLSEYGDELMKKSPPTGTDELKTAIKSALSEGNGYPSAKTAALKKVYGIDFTSSPNNILAVEYAREILKSGKKTSIYPILRKGSEHDSFGSASYIRGLIQNKKDYSEYVPGAAFDIFKNARPVFETDFENLILYKLRTATTADLSGIADISEGLENRLKNNAACKNLSDLYAACSAKRYSHARIRRALFNILLGITKTDINTQPQYIKVLAANKTGCALIKEIKEKSEIPIITKPSFGKSFPIFQKEAEITAVYAIAGTISADAEYTATPYINEN